MSNDGSWNMYSLLGPYGDDKVKGTRRAKQCTHQIDKAIETVDKDIKAALSKFKARIDALYKKYPEQGVYDTESRGQISHAVRQILEEISSPVD